MKNLERIVVLVFLIYPVRFFVASTIDDNRLVSAFNNERVWTATGNSETSVAYGFYFAIILILGIHLSRESLSMKFSLIEISLMGLFLLGIIFNLEHWPLTEIIGVLLFFLIILAIRNHPLTISLINRLMVCQLSILVLILIFPVFSSSRSFSPCTRDKCSLFGNLFTSFFPHENELAIFLFIGSIFFLIQKGVFGFSFFLLHGLLILMTGSKLVISIFLLLAFCSFFKSHVVYFFVWCAATTSAILFFVRFNPEALTGRGLIFSVGRNFFFENVFFGYGYGALTDASLKAGLISYRVAHEHNGIAALLVRHGIFGAVGLVVYLVKVGLDLRQKLRLQIFLIFGLILTFPTEANSDFSIQNHLAWVYLVVMAEIGVRGSKLVDQGLPA